MPRHLRQVLIGTALLLLIGVVVLLIVLTTCLSTDSSTGTPPPPALAHRLRQHVETLCEHPRHGEHARHARLYIEEQLRAAGWQVSLQEFTTEDGCTHCNISALRAGASPQRYIIGAHYDACDTGTTNPGADDNASAVAVLLELARRLPATSLNHTVELVAWDCEEPPYFDSSDMGSAHHATGLAPEQIRGVICLEMLGYFSEEPGSQPMLFPGYSLLLPTVGNFIAIVGDWKALSLARSTYAELRRELPTLRLNIPFAHGTDLYLSDHHNYAPRNIPAIMVTDTAMLRNPHYHASSDLPTTLNYGNMARITRALARTIRHLAAGD